MTLVLEKVQQVACLTYLNQITYPSVKTNRAENLTMIYDMSQLDIRVRNNKRASMNYVAAFPFDFFNDWFNVTIFSVAYIRR